MNKLIICFKCLSIGIHVIGLIIFGYSLIWNSLYFNYRSRNPKANFAGDFKYLTYWNLLIQLFFNLLCVVKDCTPKSVTNVRQKLTKLIDTMFHSTVFPTSMFVCVSYWTLICIDEKLVVSAHYTHRCPKWFNHVTHTMIGPMVILELIITHHEPPPIICALIIIMTLSLCYFTWILFIGIAIHYWVYPILDIFKWYQRILFLLCCFVILSFYYFGCQFLHKHCWPRSRRKLFRINDN